MKDNFDVHKWNYNRYLKESINITRGGDDPEIGAEEESDSNVVGEATEKEYEVEYWVLTRDGYDNEYITVKANSEKEALEKAEEETRRGKNFKIYKR